uniref:hypothetical protein n=1 Tax=Nocardia suismassiliense TaxID=2077092 RepID=UPI003F491AF5
MPTALRARMRRISNTVLGRRGGRIGLFAAVGYALGVGLVLAITAYGFMGRIAPVDATKAAAEIDVTRVALTVAAGVGSVVALVIAPPPTGTNTAALLEKFSSAAPVRGSAIWPHGHEFTHPDTDLRAIGLDSAHQKFSLPVRHASVSMSFTLRYRARG